MQNLTRSVLFAGLATLAALGLAARPAHAQTSYFPDDTTINYATPGDAFVGYNTGLMPSSPTVNLVPGGEISGDCEVYNGSIFNVNGGAVDDLLWAFNTSTVNVHSGTVGTYLYAINGSTVNVSGGTFGQYQGVSFADSTTGAFTFIGSGLSYAPDPTGNTPLGGKDYILTGLLQNGDSVTGDVVEVSPGATMFTLSSPVPEVSTASGLCLGLLGIAGLLFKARKRVTSA